MTGTTDFFDLRRLAEGSGLGRVGLALQETARRLCNAKFRRQWLACISATLTMVIVGTVYGWTTTSLLHLTSGTGGVPLKLTNDESSWLVSLTVVGSMFGSLMGAKLADFIGRKYCLLFCCATFTLGWLNVYTAPSVLNLYLARVILGIGVGIAYTINPIYVSEIADINIRGALGTLIAVNVFTGSLFTCILGHWLSYNSLLIVLIIISSVSFFLNTCFPETPYYLVAKRRKKKACQSITYYKGMVDPQEIKIALRALRTQTTYKLQPQATSGLPSETRSNFPPQLRSGFFSHSTSDATLSSRNFFSSQSGEVFPSLSLQELQTDSKREVIDTDPTSDVHLPSSSDSQSQSISIIHSEVISDRQPQTTGELPLKPPREFHPQPTSELHLSSRSEVHVPSTSEVQPGPTSEIQPGPTSEIQPEPTSEIQPEPTREIHSEPTSEIQPEPTSEIQPEPTSETHPEPTSDIHSETTSETHPEPTSDIHSETTSETHQRSTSEIHQPSTSETHQRSTSEIHQPSTSEIHQPSTSEIHQPSTSEIHGPSRSEIHRPSTSEIHRPSTSEIHRPSTSEIHRPSTSEIHGPSRSEIRRPSRSEIHRPSGSEIHRPSRSEIHGPSTSEIHRPSRSEIHRPSTSEIHRPSTSEVHRPCTSKISRPSTSEKHRPPTGEIHRPSTSEIHEPSTSGKQGPSKIEIHPEPTSEVLSQSSINFPSPCSCESYTQTTLDTCGSIWSNEPYVDITKQSWLTKLRVILQRNNRKALFIMLGLIMAQQLGGNFITMQYLEVLFSKTTTGIEPNIATILVLAVGLISGTLSTLTVESLGRKKLLSVSTLGSCFTLLILAIYLLFDQFKFEVSIVSALPVIDLIIYQVMFQIGLGTIPNVLLCELFPTETKGIVGAITVIFDGIIGFTVSKLYQVITDSVGSSAIYFIFATSCCLAYLMVLMWVPETKGKTYHEIEQLLVGKDSNSLNEEVRTAEMDTRRI